MLKNFKRKVYKVSRILAEDKLLRSLNAQGIKRSDIDTLQYEALLRDEIEEIKVVSSQLAIFGVALTMAIGFL